MYTARITEPNVLTLRHLHDRIAAGEPLQAGRVAFQVLSVSTCAGCEMAGCIGVADLRRRDTGQFHQDVHLTSSESE